LLWDPVEEAFVFAGADGYEPEISEALRVLKVRREGLECGMAALEREGVVQGALDDLPDSTWRNLAREMDLRVGMGIALRRGDDLIGFHAACFRGRVTWFSEPQLRVARGIGRITAFALENVRLLERLADASRMKSEFVAAVSHELRSPISVILGYTDLLRSGGFGALSKEQDECIDRVDRSGRELHELISSTLDLSRIEAGSLQLDVREVVLDDLIAEIDDEIGALKDKDGLNFAWHVGGDLPSLYTDPQKVKVVVKNLIGNAIKFTEQGSVNVEVRCHDDGVQFAVVDTGIGIPRDALARIFEAFHQERGRAQQHGVGLGLYIVRRLVDLLGGTISVESQVGQGSEFRVWLPSVARTAIASGAVAVHGNA
jgi:signal transduction histidine kinase